MTKEMKIGNKQRGERKDNYSESKEGSNTAKTKESINKKNEKSSKKHCKKRQAVKNITSRK